MTDRMCEPESTQKKLTSTGTDPTTNEVPPKHNTARVVVAPAAIFLVSDAFPAELSFFPRY